MSKTQKGFDPANTVEHVNAEEDSEQHEQSKGNPQEEGQPSEKQAEEADAIVEGSQKEKSGQSDDDEVNREIDSRVQKGVEQANGTVQKLLDIVSTNPENIEAIKESQPELFEELQKRFPGKFDMKVETQEEKQKSKQVRAAEMLLELAGKQTIQKWANEKGITPEDLAVREKKMLEDADVLQAMTKDYAEAIDLAGQMNFPHLKSDGVNTSKVNEVAGQSAKTNHHNPMKADDFDDTDRTVMRQHGLKEADYKEAIDGFQLPV